MARIRLILAWLLLAALPLQGFAAAAMWTCGGQAGASAELQLEAPHGHGHGHAAGTHADASDHHHPAGDQAAADDRTSHAHTCSACAAACHAVGLASTAVSIAPTPAPQVLSAEPFRRFDSDPPPVPDKPPRA